MIVGEVIDAVENAELKQLAVRTDKTSVRGFINSAITEIYKRFNLWEVETLLTMVTGTSLYTLDGTDTNLDMDLVDHQFLMVEEVWLISDDTTLDDTKLLINDIRDTDGVKTPKYNQIQVKNILNARVLKIVYRASPLPLLHEKAIIPLPPQFDECLKSYIGYRGHGSVKGDRKSEGNNHYQHFEDSCKRVKLEGLFNQDDLVSYKFEQRGFV